MIYTCTTNPSLDYYMTLKQLNMGEDNRSEMEVFDAGGKGVNVSIVLNNFHIQSSCLGFLGGFVKDFYLSFISRYPYIQPLFTTIKDNSRINLKIMDDKYETGLNAIGPHISDEEFAKFKSKLSSIYENDIFVLSGSIESEIEDRMIETIHSLAREGVRIVLDTEFNIMDSCLDVKPLLVKICERDVKDNNTTIIDMANKMIEKGAEYVLYSEPNQSSYLFTQETCYICDKLNSISLNTTGYSDSMVAGFIYSVIRGGNAIEMFKYAIAASIASSISNDLDSKQKIEEVFNTIEVKEL